MSIRRMILALAVSAPLIVGCGGGGPAPSNLEVQAFSTTSVSLAWTANTTDFDGYRIYRSTDGSTFTEIGTQPIEIYADNTVSEGTLYYYRVSVYKGAEELGFSNTVSVTPADYYVDLLLPNGAENLTVGSMYNISWDTNVPGFDAVVKVSLDNGSSWEDILWSWAPKTSPFPWQVGYGWVNVGTPMDPVYEWQQIVASTEADCLIYIEDYNDPGVNDTSDAVFTITVP